MADHYIPLDSIRCTRMEIPFSECVGRWYHICVKMPFSKTEEILATEKRVKKLQPIITAPFLLHYLMKRYAIYQGPMPKLKGFVNAHTWSLTYEIMKGLFVPKMFKYFSYWYQMTDLIITITEESFLVNPSMILTGFELHRLDEFEQWYLELVRVFEEACNGSHEVIHKVSFTTEFAEESMYGRPKHILASSGVFPCEEEQYKSKTLYACHTTSLKNRLANDAIGRPIERPDYS